MSKRRSKGVADAIRQYKAFVGTVPDEQALALILARLVATAYADGYSDCKMEQQLSTRSAGNDKAESEKDGET